VILDTLTHLSRGKVRDLYAVGDDRLLLVASDRLSAFDVVMDEPIPHKGRVLTAMSDFFCDELAHVMAPAMLSCDPVEIAEAVPGFADAPELAGRTTLSRRAEMLPLEFVVRGRLAGSAYEEYAARGTIHTMPAPAGLELTDALPEPLLTPSMKATEGHDVNISFDDACEVIGTPRARKAQELCLALFDEAARHLAKAGFVLADTKFELGVIDGELALCDEVITPDSSRIWPADAIVRGESPPAFDKQPFRDWLSEKDWDRRPPPPPVPSEVVAETSRRYVAAYERVTGLALSDWYGAAS
jgi:phosphoribosylaminoimidazole-succinocarboxamide synthase